MMVINSPLIRPAIYFLGWGVSTWHWGVPLDSHEYSSSLDRIVPLQVSSIHLAKWNHTVDGWNPAPVEVGSLSHYLQGLMHPRWCRISAINSISPTDRFPWHFRGPISRNLNATFLGVQTRRGNRSRANLTRIHHSQRRSQQNTGGWVSQTLKGKLVYLPTKLGSLGW